MPIITALNGETLAQPAVIPTNPAIAPFKVIDASGLPIENHAVIIAANEPAAADIKGRVAFWRGVQVSE